MSEGLKAKMERIQERAARELARELAAAVEVGDAEFLSYASTATSGIGDEFVFGGIFREAELGRKVADGFRQGAATRNGPAKKRHPDYQRRAEELWAQDSNAYKIDVARCIAREYGVSCHTVRAIIQKPMARKLMSAS